MCSDTDDICFIVENTAVKRDTDHATAQNSEGAFVMKSLSSLVMVTVMWDVNQDVCVYYVGLAGMMCTPRPSCTIKPMLQSIGEHANQGLIW